jgi:hypothetical protein
MTLAALTGREAPASLALRAAPSLADQLVVELARADIDAYFGVPGGAIEPLFNALARQQPAGVVRVVPMRSEAGAGFAADGYYRATGRLAVCTDTTGPGTGNLLTATMAAHADRIPMLLLTPQVALAKQGRGAPFTATSATARRSLSWPGIRAGDAVEPMIGLDADLHATWVGTRFCPWPHEPSNRVPTGACPRADFSSTCGGTRSR